jgi:serine/threonine protein phosphatase 1
MALSELNAQNPAGQIPDGIRIYAIGDIHGHLDLLDQVLTRIDAHLANNPISQPIYVFLGDYIDRGPASRAVLDRLIERSRMPQTIFLKGNHEAILEEFLTEPRVLDEWRKYGGLETLVSYGLRPSGKTILTEQQALAAELGRALPLSHRNFLSGLKTSYVCGDYFFVHAGVRPGIALDLQLEKDLLWIRDEFLRHEERFEKIIVHGHTPVPTPEIHSNRINIDTGAYATGILTCLMIEADTRVFI